MTHTPLRDIVREVAVQFVNHEYVTQPDVLARYPDA